MAVQRQPEEAGLWQLRVYTEEAWAHQRGKLPLLGGAQGEGQDHHKSFFPYENSQATRHCQQEQGISHRHRYKTREQVPRTALLSQECADCSYP